MKNIKRFIKRNKIIGVHNLVGGQQYLTLRVDATGNVSYFTWTMTGKPFLLADKHPIHKTRWTMVRYSAVSLRTGLPYHDEMSDWGTGCNAVHPEQELDGVACCFRLNSKVLQLVRAVMGNPFETTSVILGKDIDTRSLLSSMGGYLYEDSHDDHIVEGCMYKLRGLVSATRVLSDLTFEPTIVFLNAEWKPGNLVQIQGRLERGEVAPTLGELFKAYVETNHVE